MGQGIILAKTLFKLRSNPSLIPWGALEYESQQKLSGSETEDQFVPLKQVVVGFRLPQ